MLQVKFGGHGTGHIHTVWAGPPAILKAARLETTTIASTEAARDLPGSQPNPWVSRLLLLWLHAAPLQKGTYSLLQTCHITCCAHISWLIQPERLIQNVREALINTAAVGKDVIVCRPSSAQSASQPGIWGGAVAAMTGNRPTQPSPPPTPPPAAAQPENLEVSVFWPPVHSNSLNAAADFGVLALCRSCLFNVIGK